MAEVGLAVQHSDQRLDSGVWVSSSIDSDKNGTPPNDVFEIEAVNGDCITNKLQRQLATERTISTSSSVECDDYYTKFYRQFLSCNICRRAFDDHDRVPKYLPCLHTLCSSCVQGSINGCQKRITCPFCKKAASKDINSLPTNFNVKQMREYLGVDDDVAVGRCRNASIIGKSRAFLCEGCSKQARAIGCCGTCIRYLCRECITSHQFNTGSDDHEILILVDLKEDGHKKLQEQRLFCPMHNNQPMKLYCNGPKCQIPLCELCAKFAHREQTWHEVLDLAKVAEKSQLQLRERIEKSLSQWDPLESLLVNIHEELDQLDSNAAQAELEITAFFAQRRSELDKREQALIKAVHDSKNNMSQHLKKQKEAAEMTIASVTAMCNFADVALEEDSQVETVMALQRLKPVLDVLATRDFHTKPLSNSLVKFRHDHNSAEIFHRLAVKDLGKVQTSDVVPFSPTPQHARICQS
ncbi:E3 ubiquitin-protein ligase TRIM33-like [Amphiura filiformis]|uniref:E3 ubiquitin-protein ligase TRIM33-like n=1 Tax=Amphiura filiformis TaxID=82378 RepID=UPI003B214A44